MIYCSCKALIVSDLPSIIPTNDSVGQIQYLPGTVRLVTLVGFGQWSLFKNSTDNIMISNGGILQKVIFSRQKTTTVISDAAILIVNDRWVLGRIAPTP